MIQVFWLKEVSLPSTPAFKKRVDREWTKEESGLHTFFIDKVNAAGFQADSYCSITYVLREFLGLGAFLWDLGVGAFLWDMDRQGDSPLLQYMFSRHPHSYSILYRMISTSSTLPMDKWYGYLSTFSLRGLEKRSDIVYFTSTANYWVPNHII